MAQRPKLKRQQTFLDDEQLRDGMKMIEKYCRKKYRNSLFVGTSQEFDAAAAAGTAAGVCPSSTTGAPSVPPPSQTASEAFASSTRLAAPSTSAVKFTFDRLSQHFSMLPPSSRETSGLFSPLPTFPSAPSTQPPTSPPYVLEFTDAPISEEIRKKEKEGETWGQYILRILKFFYRRLGLKHVMSILVIIAYALLGGLIFYYLEAPHEKQMVSKMEAAAAVRHQRFVNLLHQAATHNDCLSFNFTLLLDSANESTPTLTSSSPCHQRITKVLVQYDNRAGYDLHLKNDWTWDYWNAVFYAATIFTTIGYGTLSCRTFHGRIATIIYALIGVPLALVVLNILGRGLFMWANSTYMTVKKALKRRTKFVKRRFRLQNAGTIESLDTQELMDMKISTEESPEDDQIDNFETFPIPLALLIVFVYLGIGSIAICYWEEWDYFTAFYFFFISLSTVGLGDEMPKHPHYATAFFVFFLIGLALLSMCISILQMKVENRYMAALEMIDNDHTAYMLGEDPSPNPDEEKGPMLNNDHLQTGWKGSQMSNLSSVRWRPSRQPRASEDSFGTSDTSPSPRTRLTSRSSILDTPTTPVVPSPVLGIFMARALSQRRERPTLKRSESIRSGQGIPLGRRTILRLRRLSDAEESGSATPSSPVSSRWPSGDHQISSPPSPLPNLAGSSPKLNLHHHRSLAPLSVITETSDEDAQTLLQRRSSSRKMLTPLILPGRTLDSVSPGPATGGRPAVTLAPATPPGALWAPAADTSLGSAEQADKEQAVTKTLERAAARLQQDRPSVD